jgi:glycogen debranching enzyme
MKHDASDPVHLMNRIQVGPPVIAIHQGDALMVTTSAGEITPGAELGMFAADTRLISLYRLTVDGQPWRLASSAAVSYFGAVFVFLSPGIVTPDGTPEPGKVGLRLHRAMSSAGVHEDFEITNYFQDEVGFEFGLEVQSDFADIFEVKRHQIRARKIETSWHARHSEFAAHYEREEFKRGLIYRVKGAGSPPRFAGGVIRFGIKLAAGATWRLCADIVPVIDGQRREPHIGCRNAAGGDEATKAKNRQWRASIARVLTSNVTLQKSYEQSAYDIGALRFDLGGAPHLWMPAAGVPWFVTIFGRDSLIVALQAMFVNPRLAIGALAHLKRYQAQKRDDWRDAQPGKILHEMRFGELAHFNETPHGPYYGTADASILYIIALSEAYRWTGDRRLLDEHRDAALKCLHWIDAYGDLDGDGFQEYKTFSPKGYHNQGWKDSGVAVVYPDGSQVEQPIATCELQGYVYDAKLRMAEILDLQGDEAGAKSLRSEAAALKKRFNNDYWMEDLGAYAFALDPGKKQVRTIASNAGHLLWSGIVESAAKAKAVVHRLLQPDMYSGWGVRTLSEENPAFDPNAYQLGSVWPHDNAIIAAGAKRYGLWREANQIAKGIFDAAAKFQMYRLPELFAGSRREEEGFPVQYVGANIPQAWAAGSVFMLLRAILGIDADASKNLLRLEPTLPDWLPDIAIEGMRVGDARLSIRFSGEGASSEYEIREGGEGLTIEGRRK